MGGVTGVVRVPHSDATGAGLADWDAMDADSLVSGTPVQRGWLADEDAATGYLAGVWDCTAFTAHPGPYPDDEFMLLLEGRVVMRTPDGAAIPVEAGEAFVIPKGFVCQWEQPGYVRKVFMIVSDPVPEGPANPSLGRITKPSFAAQALDGAVSTAATVFENATGRMSVALRTHAGGETAERAAEAHELFHVLDGAVTLTTGGVRETFGPGETGYIRAGTVLSRGYAQGARIIESRYAP